MIPLPPRSTRTDTLFPYTTLFRSGEYNFNYPNPPVAQTSIQAQYLSYVASLPTMILYYDNKFTVRPVPDKPYKITMDAYIKPVAFLSQDKDRKSTRLNSSH